MKLSISNTTARLVFGPNIHFSVSGVWESMQGPAAL